MAGLGKVNLYVVLVLHLLVDVLSHARGNFRFGHNLVMEHGSSLPNSLKIFTKLGQLLLVVQVLNVHFAVDFVDHGGHEDLLGPFILGHLGQFFSGGWVGEFLS